MDWDDYLAGLFFVGYIYLAFRPVSFPYWLPLVLIAILFVVIMHFRESGYYMPLCAVALIAESAGGADSYLFFSYIPVIFILNERGLKLKPWWLVLPLFSLISSPVYIPYIILYSSIALKLYLPPIKEKESETIISTDLEQEKVRESIEKTKRFPSDMTSRFHKTLESTVDLSYQIFDPYSVVILLKDNEGEYFITTMGKSKGRLKKSAAIKKGPLTWFYNNNGILKNNEFNDSSLNLGYYDRDEFIRCFIASTIEVNGKNKGIILIDRRENIPFDDNDKKILQSISVNLSTLFSLYGYMNASMLEAFRFQSLLELTGKIAGEIQLDEVRHRIFATLKKSFDNSWAIFLLKEKEGDEYYITEEDDRRYKRPIKNSITALALEKNIPLRKDDLAEETKRPVLLPEERDFEARSILFSPFSGNVKGGILLISKKCSNFNNKDLMVLNIISDIAVSAIEKAILYDHEREKAIRDGLTGVYNHRFFQEILDKRIAESRRNNDPISLLMVDIDDFKSINDKYGHQIGDIVLTEIGKIMKNRVRTSDIIARYGGEEFAIILPQTTAEKGYNLAEILRESIENQDIENPDRIDLKVTVSIGISEFPKHSKNKNDMVAAADRALYIAKEHGKNKCIIAEY